jgi:hypothetical protein
MLLLCVSQLQFYAIPENLKAYLDVYVPSGLLSLLANQIHDRNNILVQDFTDHFAWIGLDAALFKTFVDSQVIVIQQFVGFSDKRRVKQARMSDL